MAEPHVITALVSKHSELAGQIQQYQRKMVRFSTDLGHEPPNDLIVERAFSSH